MNVNKMGNCNRSVSNDKKMNGANLSLSTTTSSEFNLARPHLTSGSELSFSCDEVSNVQSFPDLPMIEKVLVVDSTSDSEGTWPSFNSTSDNRKALISGSAVPSLTIADAGYPASLNRFLALEFGKSNQSQSSQRWSNVTGNTEDPIADDPEMKTLTTTASTSGYEFIERRSKARKRRACIPTKKQAFSPEVEASFSSHSHVRKESRENSSSDESIRAFLRNGLINCNLFQGFDASDVAANAINEIIKEIYPRDLKEGEILAQEGGIGDAFYLVQYGELEVLVSQMTDKLRSNIKKSKRAALIKPGKTVGEAALMYNTRRNATLRATQATRVWVMQASLFHKIRNLVKNLAKKKFQAQQKFLSSLPIFAKLKPHELHNLSQACREVSFKSGQTIGDEGENDFYVIKEGKASLMRNRKSSITLCRSEEIHQGDIFMRNWLQNEDLCTATASSNLKCLKIASDDFDLLVAPFINLDYPGSSDELDSETEDDNSSEVELPKHFENRVPYQLSDFVPIAVAGVGNFGHVVLVKVKGCEEKVYALKLIEKNRVINTGQIEHVKNERRVMFMMDSPFIIKLYATYHDEMCVYFLLEKALGGELFSLLQRKNFFTESAARFYLGCIVLALEHIHSHMILYRDLKPENVLISRTGYVKVTDFGFAKKRNQSTSLCGTPEYMAPELITGGIQSFAVDWWCAGVILYEMVVGEVPFRDSEHMKMYEDIMESSPKLPERVSWEGQELTHRLLEKNSFRRLGSGTRGAGDIKKHIWFQSIFPEDEEPFLWNKLSNCKLKAPYKPKLTSDEDSRYFSPPEPKQEITQLSGQFDHSLYKWCEEF